MKITTIRAPNPKDYSKACDIGTLCYPERYYEGEESFVSKIESNPEGCLVAENDGEVIGYAISFPYLDGLPFPIDHKYQRPEHPDCTYIHDVCVLPEFRKFGIATEFVKRLTSNPNTYRLTAVANSEPFWIRMGFRSLKEVDYCGSRASYMGK